MSTRLHPIVTGILGGALADGTLGDFLAIIGGAVGVGAGFGSLVAWLVDADPRWGAGAGYGSIGGFVIGVLLAVVDLALAE